MTPDSTLQKHRKWVPTVQTGTPPDTTLLPDYVPKRWQEKHSMRNQATNYPVYFPLLQICLCIWQKLLQTMDTAGESLQQQNRYCKGILKEVNIIAAGHLVPYKYQNQFSPVRVRSFHTRIVSVFSLYTQFQLLEILITTKTWVSNQDKYFLVRWWHFPLALTRRKALSPCSS